MAFRCFAVGISWLVLRVAAKSGGRSAILSPEVAMSPMRDAMHTTGVVVDAMGKMSANVLNNDNSHGKDYYYDNYYSYAQELGSSYDGYDALYGYDYLEALGAAATNPKWVGCLALEVADGSSVDASCPASPSSHSKEHASPKGHAEAKGGSASPSSPTKKHASPKGHSAGKANLLDSRSLTSIFLGTIARKPSNCTVNQEHVVAGFNKIKELSPEEADDMDKHCVAIFKTVMGEKPTPELAKVSKKGNKSSSTSLLALGATSSFSACATDILIEIVDIVFTVISVIGLKDDGIDAILRTVARKIFNETTLNGFERMVEAVATAESSTEKAKAIFSLVGSVGGFFYKLVHAAWGEIMNTLSWWEKIKDGIMLFAQLALWFASDGVAFVAEVVLAIAQFETTIEQAVKTVDCCKDESKCSS